MTSLFFLLFAGVIFTIAGCQTSKTNEQPGVSVGDPAPVFQANDDQGELWSLQEHLGEGPLVVYFYPAAMTKGCTKQACSFRDDMSSLTEKNVSVVGVSGDAVQNLIHFREAHELQFPLLSDPDGSIARKFGVPIREGGQIERTIDGETITLTRGATFERWTFIIDQNGTVVYKNTDVTPEKDSKKVLSVIEDLQS